ncbi:MAG: o-succinylbenzoate synthase [Candidatus Omnitrophica bacterium]|nr:o-succinylbenzoate synthase [Candidatus Omnitrophota bacterium]
MKIDSVHLYPFDIALKQPFFVRGHERIDKREGVIIQLITHEGQVGFGEASPLPGVSAETLRKSVHQLTRISEELKGRLIPQDKDGVLDWLASFMERDVICASARFAVESAVLDLAARARGVSVCEFLKPGSSVDLLVAGLLQGSLHEVTERASRLLTQGYSLFKLKVGNRNIPLDVQKVEEVKRRIGLGSRLRLDANAAWRMDEAVLFAQNIGKNQIDYIEEPCVLTEKWEEFHRRTDLAVAVDESILKRPFDELNLIHGVDYFVMRPSVRGAITATVALSERAREEGRRVVISSAFESEIGLTLLANLAVVTGEPANLGTEEWFQKGLLLRPLVENGRILKRKLALDVELLSSDFHEKLKAV